MQEPASVCHVLEFSLLSEYTINTLLKDPGLLHLRCENACLVETFNVVLYWLFEYIFFFSNSECCSFYMPHEAISEKTRTLLASIIVDLGGCYGFVMHKCFVLMS